jgi:hypothetical protein
MKTEIRISKPIPRNCTSLPHPIRLRLPMTFSMSDSAIIRLLGKAIVHHKIVCRVLKQVPVVGDEDLSPYQIPGRCRLGMLTSRIVVLMEFIRSDKPNARFRMYRLMRFVNSG